MVREHEASLNTAEPRHFIDAFLTRMQQVGLQGDTLLSGSVGPEVLGALSDGTGPPGGLSVSCVTRYDFLQISSFLFVKSMCR